MISLPATIAGSRAALCATGPRRSRLIPPIPRPITAQSKPLRFPRNQRSQLVDLRRSPFDRLFSTAFSSVLFKVVAPFARRRRASRRTYSICEFRLRSSSRAQVLSASIKSGGSRRRNGFRSAMRCQSAARTIIRHAAAAFHVIYPLYNVPAFTIG